MHQETIEFGNYILLMLNEKPSFTGQENIWTQRHHAGNPLKITLVFGNTDFGTAEFHEISKNWVVKLYRGYIDPIENSHPAFMESLSTRTHVSTLSDIYDEQMLRALNKSSKLLDYADQGLHLRVESWNPVIHQDLPDSALHYVPESAYYQINKKTA